MIWVVAIPVDLATGHAGWLLSPTAWLAVAIAGILGAALAKVFLLRAVRRLGGTRTSVLLLSEPVIGVILAGLVLAQSIGVVQALGGIAVLAGAILAQRPARGRGQSLSEASPQVARHLRRTESDPAGDPPAHHRSRA